MTATLLVASVAWAAPPEKPTTKPATEVTATSAALHGELNPGAGKSEVSYYFTYGTEGACPGSLKAPEPSGVVEGNHKSVSVDVGELVPSSTYSFCLVAMSLSGSSEGAVETFTTLGEKPAVEDETATDVSDSGAVLQAQVKPENQLTTYRFEYATNPSLNGAKTLGEATVEGYGAETAGPASVNGLEPNRAYYWRVSATNATGTRKGATQELLTLPNPPTVSTGDSSAVTARSATISGSVNPGSEGPNSATSYFFEYGPTTNYGYQAPLTPAGVGEGERVVAETASLERLEPGATYHYRIVAMNGPEDAAQWSYGEGETFTTTATPPILSEATLASVTPGAVTITAQLDSQGLVTRYELQLGASAGALQSAAFGQTSTAGLLALSAESLSPATAYYYRLIATNPDGTAESPEASFTTPPGPAPSSPLGQPPTPPLLATPAIAFPTQASSKSKPLTNAQKLTKALKTCRAKHRHDKAKRRKCEKQARKGGERRRKRSRLSKTPR